MIEIRGRRIFFYKIILLPLNLISNNSLVLSLFLVNFFPFGLFAYRFQA